MCPVLFARLYWLVSSVFQAIIPQFPYPAVSVAVSHLRLSSLVIVSPSTLSLSVHHRLDLDWPLLVSWPRFLPAVSAPSAQWSSVSTHACPRTCLGLFFTTIVCWLLTLDCLITLWFPIKSVSFHLNLVWQLVLVTVPNKRSSLLVWFPVSSNYGSEIEAGQSTLWK